MPTSPPTHVHMRISAVPRPRFSACVCCMVYGPGRRFYSCLARLYRPAYNGARPRKDAAPINPFSPNGARPLVAAQGQITYRALPTTRPRSDVGFTSFSVPQLRPTYMLWEISSLAWRKQDAEAAPARPAALARRGGHRARTPLAWRKQDAEAAPARPAALARRGGHQARTPTTDRRMLSVSTTGAGTSRPVFLSVPDHQMINICGYQQHQYAKHKKVFWSLKQPAQHQKPCAESLLVWLFFAIQITGRLHGRPYVI